jgi:hypothetical protein
LIDGRIHTNGRIPTNGRIHTNGLIHTNGRIHSLYQTDLYDDDDNDDDDDDDEDPYLPSNVTVIDVPQSSFMRHMLKDKKFEV